MPDAYESFDKADSSVIGPNHAWTAFAAGGAYRIKANELSGEFADNASGQIRAEVEMLGDDFWAEITVTALKSSAFGNTSLGPMVRTATSGAALGDYYVVEVHNLDKVFFGKVVGGTRTNFLSGTALTLGTLPGTLRLEAKGSTISVYWRGALHHEVTDTSIRAATQRGSGVYGFQVLSPGTHGDNFRARSPIKLATFGGSITPAGTLATRRILARIFTGSVTPAGALATSVTRIATFAGSLTPSGLLSKRPTRRLGGRITMRASLSRRFAKVLDGSITPAGDPGITFLGRVLGRAGAVIMVIRRAGEVRMRFRGR